MAAPLHALQIKASDSCKIQVFITSKSPIVKGLVNRRYQVPLTHNRLLCHFYVRFYVESLEITTITPFGGLLVTRVLRKIPYAVLIPLTVLQNG